MFKEIPHGIQVTYNHTYKPRVDPTTKVIEWSSSYTNDEEDFIENQACPIELEFESESDLETQPIVEPEPFFPYDPNNPIYTNS